MAIDTTASNYLQMLQEYKDLYTSTTFQGFKTYISTLQSTDKRELFGVGISSILTLKLYREMKSIVDVINGGFYPNSTKELVQKYSEKRISNTSSSLAIGIKINKHETRPYFHVKVPNYVEIPIFVGHLWRFRVWGIDPTRLMKGVSIESTKTKDIVKSYYYIQDRADIVSFVALNRLSVDSNLLDHIELYFTDETFKYNLIFSQAVPEMSRRIFTEQENKILDSILPEISKPLLYVGRSSREATAYFSFTQTS